MRLHRIAKIVRTIQYTHNKWTTLCGFFAIKTVSSAATQTNQQHCCNLEERHLIVFALSDCMRSRGLINERYSSFDFQSVICWIRHFPSFHSLSVRTFCCFVWLVPIRSIRSVRWISFCSVFSSFASDSIYYSVRVEIPIEFSLMVWWLLHRIR